MNGFECSQHTLAFQHVIVQHAIEAMLGYSHQQVVLAAYTVDSACPQDCLLLCRDRKAMPGQQGDSHLGRQQIKCHSDFRDYDASEVANLNL